MADDVAIEQAPVLRPPLWHWLATTAGLSLVAALVGAGLGIELVTAAKIHVQQAVAAAQPHDFPDAKLLELPPIITNLADPPDAWVRLQASIVVDDGTTIKPEVLAAEIADDILGFMKTVTLAQIGGASGLQHLREDLSERATIRSQGHVRALMIQTLVVQ